MGVPPGRMRSHARSLGFTLIELVVVIVIMGLIVRAVAPNFSRTLRVARVNRASQVLSGDLERAFALAARQRKPVRITWDNGAMQYTVKDRLSGTVLMTRGLGTANSAFNVLVVTFSSSPFDIYPSGLASSALTVTLTELDYSRRVQMTRAGLTLVGP